MVFSIIFNDEKIIHKDFSKISRKKLKIILNKIESLSINWLCTSQIRKLSHYDLCDYRLRVWDYRVLFSLIESEDKIVIFRVLHRSKLY